MTNSLSVPSLDVEACVNPERLRNLADRILNMADGRADRDPASLRREAEFVRALASALPGMGKDSERRRDTVGLPLWIFDHVGERFLVAVKPDGSASIDGGHADAQGVAKARELFQRLAVIRPPHGTKYVMLTVETVPTFVGSLNEEAIAINNDAARAAQPEETSDG